MNSMLSEKREKRHKKSERGKRGGLKEKERITKRKKKRMRDIDGTSEKE